MKMKIEEIKVLLKSGDVAGAAEAAEELLKGDPDNVRALMLFGTCQQLLGDNAAFELTHETVREAKSKMSFDDDPELADEWAKFDGLYRQLTQPALVRKGTKAGPAAMEYVVIAVLIAAALAVGIWLFGAQIMGMFVPNNEAAVGRHLYAGPSKGDLEWAVEAGKEADNKWTTEDAVRQEKDFEQW